MQITLKTLRLLNFQRTTDYNTNTKPIKETFLTVENGSFHVFRSESMKSRKDWNVNSDI